MHLFFICVLVLARTGLIFAVARRGMARNLRLFYRTSHHVQGVVGMGFLPLRKPGGAVGIDSFHLVEI